MQLISTVTMAISYLPRNHQHLPRQMLRDMQIAFALRNGTRCTTTHALKSLRVLDLVPSGSMPQQTLCLALRSSATMVSTSRCQQHLHRRALHYHQVNNANLDYCATFQARVLAHWLILRTPNCRADSNILVSRSELHQHPLFHVDVPIIVTAGLQQSLHGKIPMMSNRHNHNT